MTTIARRTPTSLGEILDWFDTPFALRTDLPVTLPADAQADQVTATYTDGVLEVRVPSGGHDASSITVPGQRVGAAPAPASDSTTSGTTADQQTSSTIASTTASTDGPAHDDTKEAGDARPTR